MAEGINLRACPYLTLSDDPTLVLSEASAEHLCRAQRRRFSPDLEFQENVCLRAAHVECQRFVKAQEANVPLPGVTAPTARRTTRRRGYVPVLTALVLVFGAALVVTALLNLPALLPSDPQATEVALLPESSPSATDDASTQETASPVPTETDAPAATDTTEPPSATPARATNTPAPAATRARPTRVSGVATRIAILPDAGVEENPDAPQVIAQLPTATPPAPAEPAAPTNTPAPDEPTPAATLPPLRLTPASGSSVGWWTSDGVAGANLGDSFLYAGTANGASLLSAVRFDLSRIARGAPVHQAQIELTGLVDQRLDPSLDTIWLVQLIAESELSQIVGGNYMMLYSAPAAITLLPELRASDLAKGTVNTLALDANARQWLEQRILDGEKSVTVRLMASTSGDADNLFAWDSGFGSKTSEQPPALVLNLGAPPPTPPPLPTREYIVATFTPVPANVLTVVAQQATATESARVDGTPTPAPPFVTPTTIPENLPTAMAAALEAGLPAVVAHTPTPANEATVEANNAYATAVAVTTGTFTPVPTGYVTPFVIAPPLPAENAATEIARIAQSTAEAAEAASSGPRPTQPHNAILGVYVIATPTPANIATAAAESLNATRSAELVGTPTPTPWHWILITPTPIPLPTAVPTLPPLVLAEAFTPTPVPTATDVVPATLPDEFRGLLFFRTLRGPIEEIYALNPTTGQLGAATRSWIYPLARKQLTLSPDGKFEAIVKRDANNFAQIHILNLEFGTTRQITSFGANSYDPTWSPNGDWIAFVSTNTRNDEIYLISVDGSVTKQLTSNTWEWDKHPTWSPDGSQIAWFSNRDTGLRQLWVMNADGSNQRRLLDDGFENWDPVWTR